jgi:uncharacterized DUF497 family protein
VKFEWDEKKNEGNIRKHGFDLADGAELFELPMLIWLDSRAAYREHRFVGIGFLRQRVVVVVFVGDDDNTIRIISLRKALKHERERFGEFLKDELGADRSDDG